MMENCSVRAFLNENNLVLPKPKVGLANYVPYRKSGNQLYISGQGPVLETQEIIGKLGDNLSVDEGYKAAQLCALNILAQLATACDHDFGRVQACVKLGGFINAAPNFTEHPQVINGASDLIVNALGNIGQHARFAVGVPSLPRGWAVEIDAIFELAQ